MNLKDKTRLFVLVAESSVAITLASMLDSAKANGKLRTAEDINGIMKDYVPKVPIFGSISIDPQPTNSTYRYQKSNNVYDEGAYYLLMMYARETVREGERLSTASVFRDQ